LGLLGYPDQAVKKSHEALTSAQELAHPHSLAYALYSVVLSHQSRGEWQAAQEWSEGLMTLAIKEGFPHWLAHGPILRGWVLTEQGQGEEGIAQICQGLAAHQATGTEAHRPHHLALLAEAYGKMGQTEEELNVLAEALAAVNKNGERWWEAELYRLKGELLLAQEGYKLQAIGHREKTEEAEACFLKAIEIARKQQAKSLELRAAMRLARLWRQQSKRKQAHRLVAEIYGWFTEGFATKDLQEAKALLEALA
jgi:predicted ATPase